MSETLLTDSKATIGKAGFTGYVALFEVTSYYRSAFSTVMSCGGVDCPASLRKELPLCGAAEYDSPSGCQPCDPSCAMCVGGTSSDGTYCIG